MKKLSKIKLHDAVVLDKKEMKIIYGGSGTGGSGGLTGGCFSCSCIGQTNPPYASSWTKFYASTSTMQTDLNTRCATSGDCIQVSILNC
ncbi:MAG: hypothetical protein PHS04_05875 [Tissierellia bacterium]|jgi:natural product precursor|nr:hypothetical protein [Tissierellia bacterium]